MLSTDNKRMLRKFSKDPFFLLKYALVSIAASLALLALMNTLAPERPESFSYLWALSFVAFLTPNFFVVAGSGLFIPVLFFIFGAEISPWAFLGLPLAICWAYVSAQLMHNTAHGNIKPLWLNRLIGEFIGFHQLGGYANFTIVHLIHHKYPDDPDRDPHPPGDKNFLTYVRTTFNALVKCMNSTYYQNWGHRSRAYQWLWRLTAVAAVSARYLRTFTVFMILGPTLFAFFFVPFYSVMTMIYWHFNYSSHRPTEKGFEILDLNHNLYYKIANFMSAGTYFHKTHHERPSIFNPSKAPVSGRVISYENPSKAEQPKTGSKSPLCPPPELSL